MSCKLFFSKGIVCTPDVSTCSTCAVPVTAASATAASCVGARADANNVVGRTVAISIAWKADWIIGTDSDGIALGEPKKP